MKLHNIQNTSKWFTIVLAMWIVLIITLLALLILEYIIPFSKNVKGIENSSKAYYEANSWIEDALWFTSQNSVGSESWTIISSTAVWNNFTVIGLGDILPPVWKWNSEYDSDWNKIAEWQPIQLDIWSGAISNWNTVDFYFRVPDLDYNKSSSEILWWSNPIVNWQLSWEADAVNASWSYIYPWDVCDSDTSCSTGDINFSLKTWIQLAWTSINFASFYATECDDGTEQCSLKLSVINDLELSDGTPVPYLEWKIDFGTPVALRFAQVNSSGKSYWFKKELEVKVAQQTVIEAFDFTIFQ